MDCSGKDLALAILAVLIAEEANQVPLLEADANQNVAGSGNGEEQVSRGHHWC